MKSTLTVPNNITSIKTSKNFFLLKLIEKNSLNICLSYTQS